MAADFFSVDSFSVDKKFLVTAFKRQADCSKFSWGPIDKCTCYCFSFALGRTCPLVQDRDKPTHFFASFGRRFGHRMLRSFVIFLLHSKIPNHLSLTHNNMVWRDGATISALSLRSVKAQATGVRHLFIMNCNNKPIVLLFNLYHLSLFETQFF
jgi:hypothetical protein